jgi:serine/threonine protein kinase
MPRSGWGRPAPVTCAAMPRRSSSCHCGVAFAWCGASRLEGRSRGVNPGSVAPLSSSALVACVLQPDNLLLHSDGRLLVADLGVAQQFAVAGVSAPVRSALARAIAATAGYDSDSGRVHSDDDDRGDDFDEDDEEDEEEGPRGGGRGVTSGEDSARVGSRSPLSRMNPPGFVTDTAGTFQFLAPEVRSEKLAVRTIRGSKASCCSCRRARLPAATMRLQPISGLRECASTSCSSVLPRLGALLTTP